MDDKKNDQDLLDEESSDIQDENFDLESDDDTQEQAHNLGVIDQEDDDLNIADRVQVKTNITNTQHPDDLLEETEEDFENYDNKYIDLWGDDEEDAKPKKEKKVWNFTPDEIDQIPDEAIWDEEQRSLFDDEEE